MPDIALDQRVAAAHPLPQLRARVAVPLLAVALLYAPTAWTLAIGPWQSEDHAYSPFILGLAAWLAWRDRAVEAAPSSRDRFAWGALLGIGLLLYLCARLLGNISLETGSILFVLPGMIGWVAGWRRVAALAYPLAALPFVVPLPGSLVVALTFPLKMAVSKIAAGLLHLAGLPVLRQGISIELGNYRLLVADACSGLQSMYSLAASAIVYLALRRYRSPARVVPILLAVVPIAFAANVMRVMLLSLITYFLGDEAGQGFLHGIAGAVMFVIAFAGLMLFDALLDRVAPLMAKMREVGVA